MTMFDDIANAIGSALGADKVVGGLVAGATFTIVLIIILEWTIGDEERAGNIFIISAGLGLVLSAVFGWFPLWVPFVMGILLAFLALNRYNSGSSVGA